MSRGLRDLIANGLQLEKYKNPQHLLRVEISGALPYFISSICRARLIAVFNRR
jgi:hypothetical protein